MASSGDALAKAQAAVKRLCLERVPVEAFSQLREASCAQTLDLEVDIEDLCPDAFRNLAKGLEGLRDDGHGRHGHGPKFLAWLARPLSEGLPRTWSLLSLLGHACGSSHELVSSAGIAYLALLEVEGAESQWGTLFQPALLRLILVAIRRLRRGGFRPRRGDRRDTAADGGDDTLASASASTAAATQEDEEDEGGGAVVPREAAAALLARLVAFLRGGGRLGAAGGGRWEALSLTIEELAELLAMPADDDAARDAAEGLALLVAQAGHGEAGGAGVRRAATLAMRAVLPALLMTQERGTASLATVPRPLQQVRARALGFLCGLVQGHPVLLETRRVAAAAAGDDEEDEGEGEAEDAEGQRAKKRRRRAAAAAAAAAEDDEEEEEEDEDEEAASEEEETEAPEAETRRQPRTRRRRPVARAVEDPVLALIELMLVSTPDRSEWRSLAADSVLALLCEATAVERRTKFAGHEADSSMPPPPPRRGGATSKKGRDGESLGAADGALVALDDAAAAAQAPPTPPQAPAPQGLGRRTLAGRFLAFLERVLEGERGSLRVLASDVAVSLLERSSQLLPPGNEHGRAGLVQRLLLLLVRRCGDAVPTVRCRALGGVAAAVQFLARCGEGGERLLRGLLAPTDANGASRHHAAAAPTRRVDLPGLFSVSAVDEKPVVRRAALSFFDALLPLLRAPLGFSPEDVATFFDASLVAGLTVDESVLVRKAAMFSLALLLRTVSAGADAGAGASGGGGGGGPLAEVCRLWVAGVLPLVVDPEASVLDRALDEIEAAIVTPLAEAAAGGGGTSRGAASSAGAGAVELPPVLACLDSEATDYLQRGLQRLAKRNEGKLPSRFVDGLSLAVRGCLERRCPWPPALWSILEEVSRNDPRSVPFGLVCDAWESLSASLRDQDLVTDGGPAADEAHAQVMAGAKMLSTLEHLVAAAPRMRAEALFDNLRARLAALNAPPALLRGMTAVIDKIERTSKARRPSAALGRRAEEDAAALPNWRPGLLKSIQETLGRYVRPTPGGAEAPPDARRLGTCLFALGELALLSPALISDSLVLQVQTIATNSLWHEGKRVLTDDVVRGHAFVTLGKFCLKKDTLARKSVELLVLHLTPRECLVVRNNVLIALGDLCTHYTSLVDRFVPFMSDLMRDPNELLRRQAAMIIASLLAEDFIKLRGSVLLRFLYALGDAAASVRGLVECVFVRVLHRRNVNVFAQNFLDAICALNGWAGLTAFQGAVGNEEFSLQKRPSHRAQVYRFMLSLMTSEQKFNVCAQIVTTLLAAFVDESEDKIPLPRDFSEPGGQALGDGLRLLCCKEMRICFSTSKVAALQEGAAGAAGGAGGASGAGGATDEGAAEAAARGVLSSILKRTLSDNILPVLVQLKHLMEAHHSPFLGQLRVCLREILRDFKDDLQAVLPGDAQLASEIAYDLREGNDGEDGESIAAPGASARASAGDAPLAAHQQQRKRRLSIGSMMKTPTGRNSETGFACGSPSSSIPKPRRSLGGAPAASTPIAEGRPGSSAGAPQSPWALPADAKAQLLRAAAPGAGAPAPVTPVDEGDGRPRAKKYRRQAPAAAAASLVGGA